MSSIQLDRVACAAPDGKKLFSELSANVGKETVGLVGRNGSGKSTLLQLIANGTEPQSGTIAVTGSIGLMTQSSFPPWTSAGQALGVQEQLKIQARFEDGCAEQSDYDSVDWSLIERLDPIRQACGIEHVSMDREVDSLSGGERARVKIANLMLSAPNILLLDEPTNDLDLNGRRLVANLIEKWDGPVLVASHDRWLLERVDRIVELASTGGLVVPGGWSAFKRERELETAKAKSALDRAETNLRAAQKTHQSNVERAAQRSKAGRISALRRGDNKLQINAQKQRSQNTASQERVSHLQAISAAELILGEAQSDVARLTPIQMNLSKSNLQSGHRLLQVNDLVCRHGQKHIFGPISFLVTGPERIFLRGDNGSGKSSLLRLLCGQEKPASGHIWSLDNRIAILDQHLALLDLSDTVLKAMQRHNEDLDKHGAHAALAEYGFRGDWALRRVSSLSGGEKVRLAIACLFAREVPPQLLLLDEPTNHLDISAIETLEEALVSFDGALICTSHDQTFRTSLDLSRVIDLSQ